MGGDGPEEEAVQDQRGGQSLCYPVKTLSPRQELVVEKSLAL